VSEGFKFCCGAYILPDCRSARSRSGRPSPPPYQMYCTMFGRKPYFNFSPIHLSILPVILHGSKNEISPRFSIPVAFKALWFRNKATYWKSDTCIESGCRTAKSPIHGDEYYSVCFGHFAHRFLTFYMASKSSTFDIDFRIWRTLF